MKRKQTTRSAYQRHAKAPYLYSPQYHQWKRVASYPSAAGEALAQARQSHDKFRGFGGSYE